MRKRRAIKAFGVILMLCLLTATVILGGAAILFYMEGGSGAPSVFGYNIYLVKDNDFYQIKAGSAAISQKVEVDKVNIGEVIIFHRYENNSAQMGHVEEKYISDGKLSLALVTEDMEEIIIPADKYIARVTHYSTFLGEIIGFAMSPFGVIAIAVLPCLAVLTYEFIRYTGRKAAEKRSSADNRLSESDTEPLADDNKESADYRSGGVADLGVATVEDIPVPEKSDNTDVFVKPKPDIPEKSDNTEEIRFEKKPAPTKKAKEIEFSSKGKDTKLTDAENEEISDKADIAVIASDLERRANKRHSGEMTIDDILADLDRKK